MPVNLYDLAPIFHLLVMAMLIALLPLCWVWLRYAQESTLRRIQLLTWMTLFLTFDLVMFGAFTRLTDSGLGCPDWPGCYGFATPFGADAHIQEAQDNLPHGPVTFAKAWIEMVHRYLAMAVGGLILTLAAFAWFRRIKQDVQSPVFLAHVEPDLGLCARRIWCFDRHHETFSTDRDLAFVWRIDLGCIVDCSSSVPSILDSSAAKSPSALCHLVVCMLGLGTVGDASFIGRVG